MLKRLFAKNPDDHDERLQSEAETKRHIDTALRRQRPPTKECINDILGITALDAITAASDGFFNNSEYSHRHPYATRPIHDMSFNTLFCIIANYDSRRDNSTRYTQAGRGQDEIDFLLDELAYQGMCILLKRDVESEDLVRVIDAISKSKYLASHGMMKAFMLFGCKIWDDPAYKKEIRASVNIDEIHAAWHSKQNMLKKVDKAIIALYGEVMIFNGSSNHIKHGMYANQKPLLNREMTQVLKNMMDGDTNLAEGLEKMMLLARDHQRIHNVAKKLRNLVCGSHDAKLIATMKMVRR